MSSKLRYYKSDDVLFKPIAIMVDDKLYINLIENGIDCEFETMKQTIKNLSVNDDIDRFFKDIDKRNTTNKEPRLVISMIKNTPEVDGYQLLGTGDKDNILHYCKSATFFLNRNFKPENISFIFANMSHDNDFRSASYFASDKSVRFGSGAMSALEYFTDECENRELADFIISKHFEFEVVW